MTLRLCSDLSPADWITTSDLPWDRLVTFGPAGFPAHARLRLLPDPDHPGQSENDVVVAADAPSDHARLTVALQVLEHHTRTPEDCYSCLWDGWGCLLDGPRVVVPNRAYFLFRGSVSDVGDRGSAGTWPSRPGSDLPGPALVWPADHAWCVAHDVDPHWIGIGAGTAAIDELLSDPRIDVVRADPREAQPRYR